LIVTNDMEGVRQAALELMVISLKEEDTDRQIRNLLDQEASPETLAKVMPVRKVADGYYSYAIYLMWLRGMLDSNVELALLADEAEGLRTLQTARQQFERDHPACPGCGIRQYSTAPIRCRNGRCGMDFRKKH
jgi:hypothetical protein